MTASEIQEKYCSPDLIKKKYEKAGWKVIIDGVFLVFEPEKPEPDVKPLAPKRRRKISAPVSIR